MDKRKEILINALQDKEEDVHKAAAEALERLEVRQRLEPLEQKIASGAMLVKIRAIYALGSLRGQRIIDILLKALNDPSDDVRAAAIRVLGAYGDFNVAQHLVEALKDPSPVVVRVAVDAIGNFRNPKLIGPLFQMLKHPDQGVVERAIEAVGKLGDKRAEEAMIYFAVKGNNKMKAFAIKALGEMEY
ncbi:MAG: HEAT repeat domain-containing protein [Deltaproteobacteria bacterium]